MIQRNNGFKCKHPDGFKKVRLKRRKNCPQGWIVELLECHTCGAKRTGG